MSVIQEHFGYLEDGQRVKQLTLEHPNGLSAKLCTYGATLMSLTLPQSGGQEIDVVLGFDDLEGYLSDRNQKLGCIMGRMVSSYHHPDFMKPNMLSQVNWVSEPLDDDDDEDPSVIFTYISPDGEGGKGELSMMVRYSLTEDRSLKIEYRAETNQPTHVNLSNHTLWNLAGAGNGDILDHELTIFARQYTPADDRQQPTGEILNVADTPLDFTSPKKIGQDIQSLTDSSQGYDCNYVLKQQKAEDRITAGNTACQAAILKDLASGRSMEVFTTEPGLQLYTGNFLVGQAGKSGNTYEKHGGICLMPQHFPGSEDQPHYPTVMLEPGQKYRQTTILRFN